MKKILYIHHGDVSGGAPRSLHFLLEQIDRKEYTTSVVCRKSADDIKFFADICDETIFEPCIRPFHASTVSGLSIKQAIYNLVYLLPSYFAAKKLIKRLKPDIIHINSTCLFAVAKAAKKVDKNVRVICHIREPLIQGSIQASIVRNACLKYCDHMVAIDRFDGMSVDRKLKKTSVIYNFVDINKFNSSNKSDILRRELNVPCESTVYLVLARVSPENGILELVREWAETCNCVNKQLIIVGEKQGQMVEYTNNCKIIANKTNNIHILPFRSDITDVIASSDIMLCPFTQPHFARSIIEAAAMGKVSVSRYIDGPKELIVEGKTGFFYGNGKTLSEVTDYITNNPNAIYEMSKYAEQYAIDNFNAAINAQRTFELYK